MSFLRNRIVKWVWLVALLVFPFVLWLLPSGFFDDAGIELCPSKFLFDIECLGCGITRAVMHFHHLEFEEAAYFNKFVFFVYPFLVFLWFSWTYGTAKLLNLIGKN